MRIKDTMIAGAVAISILLALGVVGEGDYQEALESERTYVRMVCDGLWPDYEKKNITVEDCACEQRRRERTIRLVMLGVVVAASGVDDCEPVRG